MPLNVYLVGIHYTDRTIVVHRVRALSNAEALVKFFQQNDIDKEFTKVKVNFERNLYGLMA